ncbi:23S rRNA (adenine(2030)-N(6))-methyltransferase RlmJ [Enhydrobacter sp. H5]|nr:MULTISPECIES: 23S rRNA (adenine(2030)-N(6))-methyltransferase RlmJ [Moraxella]MBL7667505.1 23S rRNA (adenine(2030)-N(6))-methyltransferase RlmJ [Moraxella osloensis]MDI4480034.1 23S rRNA (adenine(2030)-N(6))-methyltransferase RlmJ [Moraxella osloensis]ONG38027.1 23S rRNA (adenine(2030)-N(6))-methyltransferase RlmJ [Enhydrobacter sp. H5]
MNYQHSYHAGNFADVVKHVLLLQLLEMMSAKPKPYYILDAYGGRGLYSLASDEAKKTGEAIHGITKLLAQDNSQASQAVQTYLQDIGYAKKFYDKHVYPGSPWFIAHHIEKQQDAHPEINNRAEAFEWKASEFDALNYQLHQLPIGVQHRNAYEGILAVLPPQEKRGLILIDPPFEQEHRDFSALVDLLVKAHKKWSTGVLALWYPIKNNDAVELFYKKMKRTEIRRQLVLELNIFPPDLPMGLNGTGMLVINPPWQFDAKAEEILQYLQPILQHPESPQMSVEQRTKVQWLVGE